MLHHIPLEAAVFMLQKSLHETSIKLMCHQCYSFEEIFIFCFIVLANV